MARTKEIELQKLDLRECIIPIIGDSPLIMNRFDEKTKQAMLEKHQKKVGGGKEVRDPDAEVAKSLYFLDDEHKQVAFPCDGIKLCMIRGAKALGLVMSDSRAAFFVQGIYSERDGRDLLPVEGEVTGREDIVKIGMGTSMLRYRGQVKTGWKINVKIRYNASLISQEQLVNMLEAGGFGCGIGEWRPERNGSFGQFHINV